MNTALMVIDFQNAIFSAPPACEAELVQQRLAGLIARARAAGLAVIYVQHDEPGSEWAAGTPTWEFPVAIAPVPGDYVSAKTNSSAFHDTALQAHLAAHGIGRLFVGGFASEFCVDSTVRHGSALGLEMVVISDAHTTRDRPHLTAPQIIAHHNFVWGGLGPVKLVRSDEVVFGK
jgi:nicotinamidase-related amidase